MALTPPSKARLAVAFFVPGLRPVPLATNSAARSKLLLPPCLVAARPHQSALTRLAHLSGVAGTPRAEGSFWLTERWPAVLSVRSSIG